MWGAGLGRVGCGGVGVVLVLAVVAARVAERVSVRHESMGRGGGEGMGVRVLARGGGVVG